MTCTKLTYRGIAYIKDDTGRYSVETSKISKPSIQKEKPLSLV